MTPDLSYCSMERESSARIINGMRRKQKKCMGGRRRWTPDLSYCKAGGWRKGVKKLVVLGHKIRRKIKSTRSIVRARIFCISEAFSQYIRHSSMLNPVHPATVIPNYR